MRKKPSFSMQQVKFRSIEECLDFLPADELAITEVLRKLVFECIPGVTEKLSFNVPFYKRHKGICFIWPASILWGKKKTYEGVRFGFQYGNMLTDEDGYLEKGDRKQVYWKDFTKLRADDIDMLKALLYEAVLLDDAMKKSK